MESLNGLLEQELKNLYALEKQIWDTASDLMEEIENKHLKKRFEKQAKYSEKNFQAVHHILQGKGINPGNTSDSVAEEMVLNLTQIQNEELNKSVKSAGMVSSLQRLAHYQLACITNVREMAKQLNEKSVKNNLKPAQKRIEKQIKKVHKVAKKKLYST